MNKKALILPVLTLAFCSGDGLLNHRQRANPQPSYALLIPEMPIQRLDYLESDIAFPDSEHAIINQPAPSIEHSYVF